MNKKDGTTDPSISIEKNRKADMTKRSSRDYYESVPEYIPTVGELLCLTEFWERRFLEFDFFQYEFCQSEWKSLMEARQHLNLLAACLGDDPKMGEIQDTIYEKFGNEQDPIYWKRFLNGEKPPPRTPSIDHLDDDRVLQPATSDELLSVAEYWYRKVVEILYLEYVRGMTEWTNDLAAFARFDRICALIEDDRQLQQLTDRVLEARAQGEDPIVWKSFLEHGRACAYLGSLRPVSVLHAERSGPKTERIPVKKPRRRKAA